MFVKSAEFIFNFTYFMVVEEEVESVSKVKRMKDYGSDKWVWEPFTTDNASIHCTFSSLLWWCISLSLNIISTIISSTKFLSSHIFYLFSLFYTFYFLFVISLRSRESTLCWWVGLYQNWKMCQKKSVSKRSFEVLIPVKILNAQNIMLIRLL